MIDGDAIEYADAYDDDGVQRTLVGMQWRC